MRTLAAITIACLAATGAGSAFAGSASQAVTTMTKESAAAFVRRKAAERRAASNPLIDGRTTASISSAAPNDARGVVVPNAEVTLGAGLAARIAAMPFKAGQRFREGETLVLFDCARHEADLRGAKANYAKARSFHSGKVRLKKRGAAGGQEVREAAADVDAARSAVEGLTEQMAYCRIDAPFTGRVVERHAQTHEVPAANAPVLTVVDDSSLELDLIVPSTWLRWMKTGTEFRFAVDELGASFPARIVRLGAKVDPVSQTIKLSGAFIERPQRVLSGMSGTATFAPPTN